jgi:hypothetical protein
MKTLICASALLLAACSMTLPVEGRVRQSTETFKGLATGYLDRTEVLSIVSSNNNAVCTGKFVYVSSRDGEGVFRWPIRAVPLCLDRLPGHWHGKDRRQEFHLHIWLLI